MNRRDVLQKAGKSMMGLFATMAFITGTVQGDEKEPERAEESKESSDSQDENGEYIAKLAGDDGVVTKENVIAAVIDWREDRITTVEMIDVIGVFRRSDGKLNGDIKISFSKDGVYEVMNTGEETVQVLTEYDLNADRHLTGENRSVIAPGNTVEEFYPPGHLDCRHGSKGGDLVINAVHWDEVAGKHVDCFPERTADPE